MSDLPRVYVSRRRVYIEWAQWPGARRTAVINLGAWHDDMLTYPQTMPDDVVELVQAPPLADLDVGCPNGRCGHPGERHEPFEYDLDGTPCRAICCDEGCGCGAEYRGAS